MCNCCCKFFCVKFKYTQLEDEQFPDSYPYQFPTDKNGFTIYANEYLFSELIQFIQAMEEIYQKIEENEGSLNYSVKGKIEKLYKVYIIDDASDKKINISGEQRDKSSLLYDQLTNCCKCLNYRNLLLDMKEVYEKMGRLLDDRKFEYEQHNQCSQALI
ncbi:MAG: hypothetical protein GY821_03840 [Gammaproteobacteria bacterium]|nr:hypothetical protein [Gammaproteobacteria bacterium]